MYSDKLTQSIARAANQVMDEQLKGDQHKIDKNKNNKIDAHDFKLLRSKNKVEESEQIDEISKATAKSYTIKKMDAFYANKNKSSDTIKKDLKGLGDAHARLTGAKPTSEEVGLEEGKMGQLSADLTDLSHADFQKEYGKPKSHFDPTNFKKPVQPGKEMDRAKALAQRGMASMKKEQVEELDEGTMTGITLGQKVKNKQGGYNQDVHHKGEKIGHIEAYKHRTGMRYGSHHDASGDGSAGNRSPEESIDDIRWSHAQHLKDTKVKKEQVEELEEMFPGTPEYEKKYGKAPQDMKKGEKKKTSQGEMEKTGKGVVHRRKFSEMLEVYGDDGIKGLFEALQDKEELIEEPTNAEFTAELEKAKNKAAGKDKADVAAAAVKGTKEMDEEVELEERELTDAEMKEREKNVKGMKKGVEGFKERYGKDAKSVMYATATKQAKKD
jgi:hypothetical protein